MSRLTVLLQHKVTEYPKSRLSTLQDALLGDASFVAASCFKALSRVAGDVAPSEEGGNAASNSPASVIGHLQLTFALLQFSKRR